jgi:hypothetical protein
LTKILPAVEYVQALRGVARANEDIFISIDDDNFYATNMVSTLAHYSLLFPHSAIAASSQLLLFWDMPSVGFPPLNVTHNVSKIGHTTDVIEGCGAVVYRGAHFDIDLFHSIIFSQNNLFRACYLSDDMLLSYVLAYSGVQLTGLYWQPVDAYSYSIYHRTELLFFNDTNAIHRMNFDGTHGRERNMNSDKYQVCYRYLMSNFIDLNNVNPRFKTRDELIRFLKLNF